MILSDTYIRFYDFWWDAAKSLDDEERLRFFDAICSYAFEGTASVPKGSDVGKLFSILRGQITVLKSSKRNQVRKGISKKTRFMVLERDGFTCRYCGAKAPDAQLEVDHVIPVSKGGTDDQSNLVTACRECNAGKRARIIGEPRKWDR